MIVVPNVICVAGVFTMGFGIMASVLFNNITAVAALANGLLPMRKVAAIEAQRRKAIGFEHPAGGGPPVTHTTQGTGGTVFAHGRDAGSENSDDGGSDPMPLLDTPIQSDTESQRDHAEHPDRADHADHADPQANQARWNLLEDASTTRRALASPQKLSGV